MIFYWIALAHLSEIKFSVYPWISFCSGSLICVSDFPKMLTIVKQYVWALGTQIATTLFSNVAILVLFHIIFWISLSISKVNFFLWSGMLVISTIRRPRREFKASLGVIKRPCLKKKLDKTKVNKVFLCFS